MENTYGALAAVAVVRELYEKGKDMYDVLAGYIKIIIATERLSSFSCAEITSIINKNNAFKLSEAVVKTALKRLGIGRDNGLYRVDISQIDTGDVVELLEEQNKQSRLLLENLYSFIRNETNTEISDELKTTIQNQLYSYLLSEETSDEYSVLISQYIMKISIDDRYMAIINRIKEGALVYEGICYSPSLSELGKWTTELTICLEQEILFYIAGYNGNVHQELYQQLLDYIDEINTVNKNRKRYIRLCYTQDVKDEIDGYFKAAEIAFFKGELIDPSRNAMLYILKDVKSKSDIQTKKVKFYNYLNDAGISLMDFDFFSEENKQYNMISEELYQYNIDHIKTERNEEYIKKCTDKINQIEILRKNKNEGIENVKYILLTANGTILKCAHSGYAYNQGEVPKATLLDSLLDRFWFKLNKGFGKGKAPKTINMVSRARLVLSMLTSNKVSKAYDEIREQYNKGEISERDVAGIIKELRQCSTIPDGISRESVNEDVQFLKDFDISERIEEIKRDEIAQAEMREAMQLLQNEFSKLQKENKKIIDDAKKKEKEDREIIEELKKRVDEDKDRRTQLESTICDMRDENDKKKLKSKKIKRGCLLITCVVLAAIVLFFLLRWLFEANERLLGIISLCITLFFAFFPPTSFIKIWKRVVTDCKL